MYKYLQINLHCCKAAQALLHQTVAELAIDLLFLSEYHRAESSAWYTDINGKAAIVPITRVNIDEFHTNEDGFCWVEISGVRHYACYWSPNSSHQEYFDFLARLEVSIRASRSEAIIVGDFNAHHTDWESKNCNKRGEALSDLIDGLGLVICNTGTKPTFQNLNGS